MMGKLACALMVMMLAIAGGGCQKASDVESTRQLPKLPPPPEVALPQTLRIAVEVDGHPAPAIDRARLARTKPDFQDLERRAWRLTTLLPEAARPGAVAEVTGDQNVTLLLRQSTDAKAPLPVLTESRRGGIVAAMVAPSDPFPAYHGQGRRLSRPGDPLPRVGGVTRIRVYLAR